MGGAPPDPPEGLLLPEGTCTPHGQGGLGGDPAQACRVIAHTSRLPLAFPSCHSASEADARRDWAWDVCPPLKADSEVGK